MGNRPRPGANGVDLAQFAERAKFEALVGHYATRSNQLRALGLNVDVVLLTCRFEVFLGVLAQALGVESERLMLDVERQAVERALDRFDTAETELRAAQEQHKREGLTP